MSATTTRTTLLARIDLPDAMPSGVDLLPSPTVAVAEGTVDWYVAALLADGPLCDGTAGTLTGIEVVRDDTTPADNTATEELCGWLRDQIAFAHEVDSTDLYDRLTSRLAKAAPTIWPRRTIEAYLDITDADPAVLASTSSTDLLGPDALDALPGTIVIGVDA